MDFATALDRRRMVREYLDQPVAAGKVERILDAARRSPTAGHSQGVSLVVVTDPDRRRALALLAGEEEHVAAGRPRWISTAPVLVIPVVEPDAYRRRYDAPDKAGATPPDAWGIPYWWVDAGAALMSLLLATAAEEGLGAGFLGAHAVPGLAASLGLPDGQLPLGIVTVGHAAPDPPAGSAAIRPRRARDDAIRRETWDGR